MTSPEPTTGVLLVGGDSRRFGSPKALARFGGETLAERAWRLLGEVCDDRLALGKQAALGLPIPVRDDGIEVHALDRRARRRAARDDDRPRARRSRSTARCSRPPTCTPLAAACRDAAVPQTGPLPGAYRRSALPALERALAGGRLKIRDALAGLDVAVVELPPERLVNVNTPAELEALEARTVA